MTQENGQAPQLEFEGRIYKVDELTDAGKQELANLQQIDGLLHFHNTHVQALSITKSTFLANLREALKDVPSVEAPKPEASDEE